MTIVGVLAPVDGGADDGPVGVELPPPPQAMATSAIAMRAGTEIARMNTPSSPPRWTTEQNWFPATGPADQRVTTAMCYEGRKAFRDAQPRRTRRRQRPDIIEGHESIGVGSQFRAGVCRCGAPSLDSASRPDGHACTEFAVVAY